MHLYVQPMDCTKVSKIHLFSAHLRKRIWGHVAYIHLSEDEKTEKVEELGTEQPDRGQGRHSWDQRP